MESSIKSFALSPTKQEIELKAGETYEGYVLLTNPLSATEDLEYSVSVKPYSVSGQDYQPDFETVSEWSRIIEWTTIEETTGTLLPNESRRINFKIEVPESAPAGGQYAMIGVSATPTAKSSKSEIRDTYTLTSLIYAKVDGETVHEGGILENYIPGFISSGTPTTVVTVSNSGNVHEKLTVELKIKNVFSGEYLALSGEDTDVYESLILPDSTRAVSRALGGLPNLGIYEVSQDASYLGENSSNTTIMVICPPWFMVLSIITITAVLTLIIRKIYLHFKNANVKIET